MPQTNRRNLLRGMALGTLLAAAAGPARAAAAPFSSGSAGPGIDVPGADPRIPAPQGVLSHLPDDRFALTIDDGTTGEVVAAYANLCRDNGFRLTFFPNGAYRSWSDNAGLLRPLVDSGQIQLGNHTWSHPDITKLTHDQLVDQITRNEQFLQNTFGVSGRPFFRPPYGSHNAATDRIATDLGYYTITLWSDTVGDSRVITAADVATEARRSFQPGNIVLGHANQRSVIGALPALADLIHSRNLATVTLADVYSGSDTA